MTCRNARSPGLYAALVLALTCHGALAQTPGTASVISLSAANYVVAPSAGAVTIILDRLGGSAGAVTANYGTADGTAVNGTDYVATFGSVTWADGDSSPKSFTIPILPGSSGADSFTIGLTSTFGANFGVPDQATVSITAPANGSSPGTGGASTVEFSASTYDASIATGAAVITIERTGGSNSAVIVNYVTSDGTAVAGVDYQAASGTLTWNAGDVSPKSFTVPILAGSAGGNSFNVSLQSSFGANFGTPDQASVAIAPAASAGFPPGVLAIRVQGNKLVDGAGEVVQLRGASISGLENTAIQGWTTNPWGDSGLGTEPNWSLLTAWKMNVVRLPLNEDSWLGYTCTNADGSQRDPDPGDNYQATVEKSVADAVAAGLYVILDLHWSAPYTFCPLGQAQMADADNSIDFWTSIASTFKSNPAVVFELFNEPFGQNLYPVAASDWSILLNGGSYPGFTHQNSDGSITTTAVSWQAAGMQSMINAIRATGATNVILSGTMGWNGDLSQWLGNAPTDSAGQMAAAWHVYPWSSNNSLPAWTGIGNQYGYAQNILAAQIPLVITESGESYGLEQNLLPWADANSVSYLLWSWNPWGNQWDLIQDDLGTPTAFGSYYQGHLACVAAGNSSCP